MFFMGKTQLVPAGYVVNKNGLGGVGVGPQQNRNSHIGYGSLVYNGTQIVENKRLALKLSRAPGPYQDKSGMKF